MLPALLGEGKMVALGHWPSPGNTVCSLLLSHRNKRCGCAVFIGRLVLGGKQGPGGSMEEPLWASDGCGVGWGCQGTPDVLWEGDTPMVGQWQLFSWED